MIKSFTDCVPFSARFLLQDDLYPRLILITQYQLSRIIGRITLDNDYFFINSVYLLGNKLFNETREGRTFIIDRYNDLKQRLLASFCGFCAYDYPRGWKAKMDIMQ